MTVRLLASLISDNAERILTTLVTEIFTKRYRGKLIYYSCRNNSISILHKLRSNYHHYYSLWLILRRSQHLASNSKMIHE
jgi:hypothetical protein